MCLLLLLLLGLLLRGDWHGSFPFRISSRVGDKDRIIRILWGRSPTTFFFCVCRKDWSSVSSNIDGRLWLTIISCSG
ncbi:hypothetical protein BCR42DRAFT_419810 [Absidia repens]|uniref:Secreted protein n=1 Tax=Absidia repens TaxID=90262 RepID=A0A1X2IBS1_9FUNG|nr:hypothetical protein BCR42DRAFT_419810 [Absidia repens]